MTDDIVARLRQECGCQWIPWNEVPCKPCRAADEIERLRALCNDLYHDATCAQSFCRLCGEGIREWEARRG